jgi:HrpA-like RNA helicase
VVDSGLVKKRMFLARTGMDCLTTVSISKAEAWQRSGKSHSPHTACASTNQQS